MRKNSKVFLLPLIVLLVLLGTSSSARAFELNGFGDVTFTNSTKTNTLADRFFVLVPETEFLRGKKGMQPVPYEPPQGYKVLLPL